MLKAFEKNISDKDLLSKTDRVLLTVSGGPDSVVMCELFHRAGFKFSIAHCNFNLRGKESDGDEEFVEALAEHYKAEYHCASFNTSTFAKEHKLSIQAAARELRYEWFADIAEQYGYEFIATAHHADDSIETFLINLTRGTGIAGLHGIPEKQGKIIRPLLPFGKEEILRFARNQKLQFREDSSNASDKYLRNKVRLKLLPLLRQMNPSIDKTLLNEIGRLQEVEKVYKKAIGAQKKKVLKKSARGFTISIDALKRSGTPQLLLFECLSDFGFRNEILNDIFATLDGEPGKQFFSGTHRLIRDRKTLIIEPGSKNREAKFKGPERRHQVTIKTKRVELDDKTMRFRITPAGSLIKKKNVACLDLDKLAFPLELRKWQKGDVFHPFGLKGKKKLSDFFVDQKLSLDQKENTWLLCSGGTIAWVAGMRSDERFKVDAGTKKIFVAELV